LRYTEYVNIFNIFNANKALQQQEICVYFSNLKRVAN